MNESSGLFKRNPREMILFRKKLMKVELRSEGDKDEDNGSHGVTDDLNPALTPFLGEKIWSTSTASIQAKVNHLETIS